MQNNYRPSAQERAVIAAAQVCANASLADIAKETGLRPATVQYTLKKLKERKILGRKKAAINRTALGQIDHLMYFSVAAGARKTKEQLLSNLQRETVVSWVGELGGSFTLGVTLSCSSNAEFHSAWCALADKFQDTISNRAFAIRLSLLSLNRRYLTGSRVQSIELESNPMRIELDATDDRILSAMTSSNWDSMRDIARATGIPLTTLTRRVRCLEENKVIAGYYYLLDRERLGMETFKFMITVRSPSAELSRRLKHYTKRCPNLTTYIECCGGWDYELTAEVTAGSEVPPIIEDLHGYLGTEALRIEAVPIFSYLKTSQHIHTAPRSR